MTKKIVYLVFLFLLIPARPLLALVANDELYDRQAGYLEQMNIPSAWGITTGSPDIVIAVIDSGIDMDHPDIIGNIWFNRGEKALNGIDDDNNGYVDDLNGWDFLANSSDPHPKFDSGYNGDGLNHGTYVAGIAAGVTNNAEGIAGVCWRCKIMPLRAIGDDGNGETAPVIKAIDYAIANGADIINMSLVGPAGDTALASAVARAYGAGLVVVASAGNDGSNGVIDGGDLTQRPLYPACSDGDEGNNNVIGVIALDQNNKKAAFSNYGSSCVDVAVPGLGLLGPKLYDKSRGGEFIYRYLQNLSGTSVAAPLIAGIAGLVKAINPTLSNSQITSIILSTAKNIDKENPQYIGQLGGGLADALAAVTSAQQIFGAGAKSDILTVSGSKRKVEILKSDKVGRIKSSWQAYPDFFRGGGEAVSADLDGDGKKEVIVGAGPGGGPQVRVFSPAGLVKGQFFAYDKNFRGGVHVAAADFDNDGKSEIITAAGTGLSSEVKIFDALGNKKWSFNVGAEGLKGGVTVAAADIDNDGQIEIITGTGGGSLPTVQIFDKLGNKRKAFSAYPDFFRGGVNVAVGDIDNDGQPEIVTTTGSGGGPQVRIFSPAGLVKGQFFAFDKKFRGGASIAVANIDNDEAIELIVGSGAGQEPEVRIFSKLGQGFSQESSFMAFEQNYRGGVNVGI